MRSMPPASSHLADRPVPAPPPMIGTPRRFMSWNLSSRALRSKRGMALLSSRVLDLGQGGDCGRSEEHTSELQSLMRISDAVFCLKKQNLNKHIRTAAIISTTITTNQTY